MRELQVVDVSDPLALWEPLRAALSGDGPAVLPRPGGAKLIHTAPLEVPEDVALVIETSGTTGSPKRVLLSGEALLASAAMAQDALGGPGTWLLALPAHYIAGVQVLTRSLGGGVPPRALHPQPFSSVAVADIAASLMDGAGNGPLYTSLVPAQLQRLLDDAATMPVLAELMRRFDRILVGGQSLPRALADRVKDAGWRVTTTYGSSETAGGCVWDQKPLAGVAIREIDGRIALAGPMLAQGYLDNPEGSTRSFVTLEGTRWYRSDDAGFIDQEGLLNVQGRLDDVIISGGVKVSLGEIERVIHESLDVPGALVVAQADAQWGTVPVVVAPGVVELSALRSLIQAQLGPAARPHRTLVMNPIPVLASGKPDRLAVTQAVAAGNST